MHYNTGINSINSAVWWCSKPTAHPFGQFFSSPQKKTRSRAASNATGSAYRTTMS